MFTDPNMNALARLVGRNYQQQVFNLRPDSIDDEDPMHDHAIGQALLTSIVYDAPRLAFDNYNAWAEPSGFGLLSWGGTFKLPDGRVSYLFGNEDGTVSVNQDFRVEFVRSTEVAATT
jgi:hypothetical protein